MATIERARTSPDEEGKSAERLSGWARERVGELMEARRRTAQPVDAGEMRRAVEQLFDPAHETADALHRVVLAHLAEHPELADDEVVREVAGLHRDGELALPVTWEGLARARRRREGAELATELAFLKGLEGEGGTIAADERYTSWALCEELCDAARRERDPEKSRAGARLALDIARRLHRRSLESPCSGGADAALDAASDGVGLAPSDLDARGAENLLAYALAHLGNALRKGGDLRGASEHFYAARSVASAVGEDLDWDDDLEGYHPVFLALEASWLMDVRRVPEAVERLRTAVEEVCADLRRPPRLLLLARMLIALAKALEELDELREALEICEVVKENFGETLEADHPDLYLNLLHNLAWCAANLGRVEETRRLLPAVRAAHAARPASVDGLRLSWLEARLAEVEGDLPRARRLLTALRDDFLAVGQAYDVALVSLELAAYHAEEGDTARVKALAEEMLPLFLARDVHREAFAALGYLVACLAREARDTGAIRVVHAFLRRSRADESRQFELPGGEG